MPLLLDFSIILDIFARLNCYAGESVNRILMTGAHVVQDIFCKSCDQKLGWTYVEAHHSSQTYKEGKFVLERALIKRRQRFNAEELMTLLGLSPEAEEYQTALERFQDQQQSFVSDVEEEPEGGE
jgi:hypothetical protein